MSSDWRKVRDIITYYGKGVTPKYVDKSSIIILNQKCIRNNRIDISFAQFIDDSKSYNEEKILRVGDILINSTGQGTAGRIALVETIPEGFRLIVDSHILVLRTSNFYESKCLNYSLFSIEWLLQKYIDGSTGQGELDKVRLFNIQVNYPQDIEEQKKIVSILSALDNKIELNNKINAELEQRAKTLYNYWFVQFDFPNASDKPYKSSGGKMVYNDILKRDVPEGWKVGNILCISDLLGGGTPSKKNEDYWDGEIPFFTPSDANHSVFSLTTLENITSKGLKESSTKLFSKGTIFLTARGSVGNIMIASRQMAMNQSCYALKPLSTGYAFLYLTTLNMVGYLKAKSSGSVFNSIVSNDIKQTPVLIPDIHVRERFEENTMPIFERILVNLEQNQQLSSLRDWLLPMLMNGQAKVLDNYALSGQPINIAVDQGSEYQKTTQLNIPSSKKGFAKQVLAGRIISLFKNDPHFTDIKFQKIQFLAEHIIQADLNLNYYYQVAGPYDNIFMHTIYNDLKKNKWYECKDRKFAALEKQGKIEEYYQNYFGPAIGRLDKLFSLLSGATEAKSEIIATIYAVWNNFIIEEKPLSESELIQSFYDWSDRKHQYTKTQILEGLQWLRENHLEPTGFGKLIKKAKSKK
jgi:type I restriction enzyme S subunit